VATVIPEKNGSGSSLEEEKGQHQGDQMDITPLPNPKNPLLGKDRHWS
jgi:hypothetical protein